MLSPKTLFTAAIVLAAGAATAQTGGVPPDLLSTFTTGLNITRWFCYLPGGNLADHYAHYLTPADYDEFKKLHIGFVRLCITPEIVDKDGELDQTGIAAIDQGVDQLIAHGITVIWDLHDNGQMKLDQPAAGTGKFVSFWAAIAAHYKGINEHSVVFELLNEPQFYNNADVWTKLQEQNVQAIRKADPRRTIMVTCTRWSGVDTFLKMDPLPEKNLIYTFHCYDPFFFTHQGASWAGEYPGKFKHIPFPSSPETVTPILPDNDKKYWGALIEYGKAHYDDDYLESRLAGPMDWGKKNGVPVVLGEFGAYPPVSPPVSRAHWFDGMRKAIAKLGVPNALWGYDDALGLGRELKADGTLQLDPNTLTHLYGQ
jgi:aryl-phospho-beta-D-glucosidase BglC (GH1 family)